MKKLKTLSILLVSLCLFSCEDDDTCGLNGQVNGDCFQVVEAAYNIQNLSANGEPFTRENLFLAFQFDNGAERYQIRARSNQFGGQDYKVGGVDFRFEPDLNYNENAMTFNGDANSPATGQLTVTFSKVDRDNGLVSGSFVWAGASTGATTSSLSGSFTDVAVSLEN